MLYSLYEAVIDSCLIEGITKPQGWGETVRKQVIPLLNHPKLRHHQTIIEDGFQRFSQPISVFVVGEGKFGKSTLINALIGQGKEIAKTHFLPATWHITRYIPREINQVYEIHYNHQLETAIRLEKICDNFRDSLEIFPGKIQFKTLEILQQVLNLEETEKKHSPNKPSSLWQVVQSVPPLKAANNMELVDTPGLAQTRLGAASQETIEDFYHRADVVLWVMIADKLNSQETQENLESLSRYGKPIIGVINRADLIPSGQRELVISKIQDSLGSFLSDVVLLSAKQAFDGYKNQNQELLGSSGLPILLEKIDDFVVKRGQRTQAYSIYNTSVQAAAEAKIILEQEAKNLEYNLNLYQQNLQTANSYQQKGKEIIERELALVDSQIKAAGEKAMNKTKKVEEFQAADDPVFDYETVQQALREQTEAIRDKLIKVLQRQLEIIQEEISLRSYQENIYGGNAKIKAHTYKTAVLNIDGLVKNLIIPKIEPQMSILEHILDGLKNLWEQLVERIVDRLRDWIGISVTEAEKELRKKQAIIKEREKIFSDYIRGLNSIAKQCVEELEAKALISINSTTQGLSQEVNKCFNDAFVSPEAAKEKIELNKNNAQLAFVPTVVLETLYNSLKAA